MRNLKLKQAFAYRFRDSLAGTGVFLGIMLLVLLGIGLLMRKTPVDVQSLGLVSLSGYAFSAGITIFIFGICSIREDMRVMNQHGVSRRTIFLANLLAAIAISAIMALVAVVGMLLGRLLNTLLGTPVQLASFFGGDVFGNVQTTVGVFGIGFVSTVLLLLLGNLSGSFLSLLFYRLPKVWKVIVGIALPLFVMNGLPLFVFARAESFNALMSLIFSSVWSAVIALALLCALVALIDWLLMRRAPIRAAK